jgi:hypothetical protein
VDRGGEDRSATRSTQVLVPCRQRTVEKGDSGDTAKVQQILFRRLLGEAVTIVASLLCRGKRRIKVR